MPREWGRAVIIARSMEGEQPRREVMSTPGAQFAVTMPLRNELLGNPRDHRHRTATGWALVLGAAGHEGCRTANQARNHAADGGASMTGCRNVGVVKHGMSKTAQHPIRGWVRFRQHLTDA